MLCSERVGMLPVQVKSVSSSSCTLSQASALLQRFLCSDACSDSFARDYVAHVAQALQDPESRRSGRPESTGAHRARLPLPTPSASPSRSSKKLVDVKQSIFVAGNTAPSPSNSKPFSHGKKNSLVAKKLVPSGFEDAHTDEKLGLPSAEDADASMEVGSVMPEAELAFERHNKKRGYSAVENGLVIDLPHASEIGDSDLMHHDNKRRKKEKQKTGTENIIKELHGPDDQRHHDRKRRKEKQEMETKIVETDCPALDNQSSDSKKRRMKKKEMETLHVPADMGSPLFVSHVKRKVEVSHMDANNVRKSVMPMSGTVEELAGSFKRKQKEGQMFPSATLSLEKKREGMEASPVEFENPVSDEKKKTKKKRRKEELGELVRRF